MSLRQTLGGYYPTGAGVSPSRKNQSINQVSMKTKSMRHINNLSQSRRENTPNSRALGTTLNPNIFQSNVLMNSYNPVEYAKQSNLTYLGSSQGKNKISPSKTSALKPSTTLRKSPSSYLIQPKTSTISRSISRKVLPSTNIGSNTQQSNLTSN
jgi:hypothetical protein